MRNFAYGRPSSLEQATAFLAKSPRGTFLMGGGTDLI
ncbi:MAG: xanthine dehydrogenase family protein subunit M, partial [Candidatus Aminicenantes bacterium]|nr:xanthine dehydrogenase family protein subunit M [Candidatus Aminicenantes bacterium]